MKKILALALAIVLVCGCVLALASCGNNTDGKKVAYVLTETGDTYSQGLGSNFKTAFENLGGKVVQESFPKNTSDFSAYLQKAIDVNAAVIFAPNSTTVAANLIKQANDLGISVPIMAGDTWESSVILDAVKGTSLNVYCSTFFDESDSSNAAKEFVTGFRAWLNANPAMKTDNGGNDIVAAVSALGFDAYNVAFEAIKTAAAEKGEAMTSLDVARALWKIDMTGVAGSIKFDSNGDAIKDSAYIKKAGSGKFDFVKVQTVTNDAKAGTPLDYADMKNSIALDTVNKKIIIGIYEPTSGDNADGGKQEVIGIKYANSLQNKITIGGNEYTVEVAVSDNGSSDEKAVSAASKLVSDGAMIVLGSYGSGVSIAAASTFEEAGLPAIGISCTNAQVTAGNPLYFRTCFLDPFQGSVMASFAFETINKK